MKKLFAVSAIVVYSLFGFSQEKFTYTLEFESIDQFQVKKAVGILDPIFESHVILSEDYQLFLYHSTNKISDETIESALNNIGISPIKIIRKED